MHKLVGNDAAYDRITAYFRDGRLPHALLIEGPGGSGKGAFARWVAQGALCSDDGRRPCGTCRDCVKVEKDLHPDLLRYGGSGGPRSFHIDTVRKVRQEAYIRPNEARGKVLLLRDVQDMSVQAQNALLKIIEEPPKNVTFLLTCDNRAALLETVRSRVTVIPLEIPPVSACRSALEGLFPDGDGEEIRAAAERFGGNVGRALEALSGEAQADTGDGKPLEILTALLRGDELTALAALAAYERDRQGLAMLLEGMRTLVSGWILRPCGDQTLNRLLERAGRLRLMKILAIIEETMQSSDGNMSGLLLVTAFCAKVRGCLEEA